MRAFRLVRFELKFLPHDFAQASMLTAQLTVGTPALRIQLSLEVHSELVKLLFIIFTKVLLFGFILIAEFGYLRFELVASLLGAA